MPSPKIYGQYQVGNRTEHRELDTIRSGDHPSSAAISDFWLKHAPTPSPALSKTTAAPYPANS
jgi:hypothetical protein